MAYSQYAIETDYTPSPSKRRPGLAMTPGVKFVVAHDTGNPGATAAGHGRFYRNDPNPVQTSSAHIFVDDKQILELIPALTGPPEQARHVLNSLPIDNQMFGYNGNAAAVGVEYCFGGAINADEAYDRYVFVLAMLCDRFGLNPLRHIVGHSVLDPDRRTDPGNGLSKSGRSYDQLIIDVKDRFVAEGGSIAPDIIVGGQLNVTVHLRVRTQPRRMGEAIRVLRPGDTLTCVELVDGDNVFGNATWCRIADGEFCWSGGVIAALAAATS